MNLFEEGDKAFLDRSAPLAARMRPRVLSEFIGQEHILGVGRLLRRSIDADMLSSILLYGPPGTGKTTLAKIIANTTRSDFISMNAVLSGIKDIRDAVTRAQDSLQFSSRKTILFIDEVHRFNKAQQDALLPHVENGTVILIGATTENPYFEVNKALVSRSRIFQLQPLQEKHLEQILRQALQDKERGYGRFAINLHEEAINHFVKICNGDARSLLNAFELAVNSTLGDSQGVIQITLQIAEESIQKKAVLYDKDGDAHYDTISAFIKSLRGSDPDATLYWMSRMIYAGEDPKFIFRRMIIFASEDVGLADPHALSVVMSAAQAYDYVGMPEGQFHLSHAALFLATCPKSNSTMSYFDALNTVQEEQLEDIPNHLKDSSRDKEAFGHGANYKYPHAYRDHWVEQQYLPDGLQGKKFYQPSSLGYEGTIQPLLNKRRELQLATFFEGANFPDLLLNLQNETGGVVNKKQLWQQRTKGVISNFLEYASKMAVDALHVKPESLVLDLNFGSGLIAFDLMNKVKNENVYTILHQAFENQLFQKLLNEQSNQGHLMGLMHKSNESLTQLLNNNQLTNIELDRVIGFRAFMHWSSEPFFDEIRQIIKEGKLVLFEIIPKHGQRPLEYLKNMIIDETMMNSWRYAEDAFFSNSDNILLQWDEKTIVNSLNTLPKVQAKSQLLPIVEEITMDQSFLNRLFTQQKSEKLCYGEQMRKSLSLSEYDMLKTFFEQRLLGAKLQWKTTFALISADFLRMEIN